MEKKFLCGECLSDKIKKEGDLYICENCGYSSEILDGSVNNLLKDINAIIGNDKLSAEEKQEEVNKRFEKENSKS